MTAPKTPEPPKADAPKSSWFWGIQHKSSMPFPGPVADAIPAPAKKADSKKAK